MFKTMTVDLGLIGEQSLLISYETQKLSDCLSLYDTSKRQEEINDPKGGGVGSDTRFGEIREDWSQGRWNPEQEQQRKFPFSESCDAPAGCFRSNAAFFSCASRQK